MIQRTACLMIDSKNIWHYQAVEKYLMETLPDSTALLLMSEVPTAVVMGKKEDPAEVCRQDQLAENGGSLGRRISGGNTWFVSEGVLCFSLMMPKYDFLLPRQTSMLGMAVGSLGVAYTPGWNGSLSYMGRGFCHCAYYKNGGVGLHHGNVYCDADLGHAALYLSDKRNGNAVNLSEIRPGIDVNLIARSIAEALGRTYQTEPVWMDAQLLDEAVLAKYAEGFSTSSHIAGDTLPDEAIHISENFPWGHVSVGILEEGGIIRNALIHTDAMESAWFELLEKALFQCPYLISAITGRFSQNAERVHDMRLRQMAIDLCRLICGHIRQADRKGES